MKPKILCKEYSFGGEIIHLFSVGQKVLKLVYIES